MVNMICHTTFGKACVIIMLPCEVSKQLAKQRASWLGSPASGQPQHTNKTIKRNLSSSPSYKSRRSFGLSSVFPSVCRHIGPNPDSKLSEPIRLQSSGSFLSLCVLLSKMESHTSLPVRNFRIIRRGGERRLTEPLNKSLTVIPASLIIM